jgi:hypothetical protein
MGFIETLGFALGTSFAAGLNLYAATAALGLLHRFGVIALPGSLDVLAHPAVIGIALLLFAVEFFADKVPYLDSAWDVIHTFIRPPAAALTAYAAFGHVPEAWRVAAALIGGSVALTAHGTKASTRAAVNASPEPVSNWLLSFAEDGISIGLVWLASTHPYLTGAVVLVLLVVCAYLLAKLFGFLRRAIQRALRPRTPAAP